MNFPEPTEEWRTVPGFHGRYEVSNNGRVRSLLNLGVRPEDGIMSLEIHHRGYLRVRLYRGDKRVWRRVHRMVCEAFVGPKPEGDFTVDHEDFNKKNNAAYNLSWMSRKDNWQRWRDREIETGSEEAPF